MKISKFVKNIYGENIYIQIIFMWLLVFIVATAQFIATQHLGLIIDAVEKGYKETIHYFYTIFFALLIYIVGTAIFSFYSGKITAKLSYNLQSQIGKKICFAHYQAIEQLEEGELHTITSKDVESIKNMLAMLLKVGCLPAKLGLVPIYLFQCCDWRFSLFILFLIPLNAILSVLIAWKLTSLYRNEKKAYANVLSFFNSTIQFIMMIKAFQLEQVFQKKHREELNGYITVRKKRMRYEKVAEEFNRCYGHISRILILLLGAYFIFIGEMTLGTLTSVILLSEFVGEGLKTMGDIPACFQNAKVSAIRIKSLLEMQNEIELEMGEQTVIQLNELPVLEVKGLSFSYSNISVLHDIKFYVGEGEKIAIVGPSGCGKTTLFKLLSGLYVPEKNKIYFKGIDIAGVSSKYLRSNITVTTQESFLFNATFKDNIAMTKLNDNEEEISTACKNAQIDSFIKTLDYGYDTEINTTIQSISNGQMQRINLARSFFRNTNIFLLDEPTSALDSNTARLVWNYLFSDCADKTMMIILHDLEEIYRFDKILVLDKGEVVGFGTHKELIQRCELYRHLYNEKSTSKRKEEV